MYSYINGSIEEIEKNYIVVENQGMGYLLYVSNPYEFKHQDIVKVYVYQQVKEDDILLFGFKNKEEKELFLKLILVKGIGCKTAIGMLAIGDITNIISAIETSNVAYLKKIPGIGPKAAQQIILDLQGKFKGNTHVLHTNSSQLEEAGEVLMALGYKRGEIDKVLATMLNDILDTNGYVKKALSILVK